MDDLPAQHWAVEAQIHKGVRLCDVQRVIYHLGDLRDFHEHFDSDLANKLISKRIKVEVYVDASNHEMPKVWREWLRVNAPNVLVRDVTKMAP